MMSRERNDEPNVAELAADAEEKLWELVGTIEAIDGNNGRERQECVAEIG